ncbi:MAG: methylenetetrahydromethanopterin dehydrogenase [Gammaproteobacteria bacterium]|jgi:methylene-tetrahydromethanopterin dehydrogenase
MEKPYLLHMLTPTVNVSPFDVNLAYDAGWNAVTPYTGVGLEDVTGLVQDAIFSRGPKGARRTGMYLGGRDVHLAVDMLEVARQAMVPPFEVSVFADPSGAFTTAAAMVAVVKKHLAQIHRQVLAGANAVVFGTGPVGTIVAVLAAREGARVKLASHLGMDAAQHAVALCGERYGVTLEAANSADDDHKRALLRDTQVVFSTAKAGVQILSAALVAGATQLKVAADVNAVPPAGIEGVGVQDDGVPIQGSISDAVGVGALAVGNVKYKIQYDMLCQMREADEPQYLGFAQAYEAAAKYAG